MRALIVIGRINGGAPLSALQYAESLKELNYEVDIIGTKFNEKIEELFLRENLKIKHVPNLDKSLKKVNLVNINKFLNVLKKSIKKNKYNLILSVGNGNLLHFSSLVANNFNCKFIGVIAGGSKEIVQGSQYWITDNVICFSEENKIDIVNEGFDESKIRVISNRISISNDENYVNHYKSLKNKQINFLLVSRLDKGKINSIISSINLIEWLNNNGINASLQIAGDGENFQEICEVIEPINSLGKKIITLKGHVKNLRPLFLESHFVMGKGRSVIEPVMMNRMGIVVGEDDNFSKINLSSFENLKKFNFSGRNISIPINKSDFYNEINKLINDPDSFLKNSVEIFEIVRNSYHSKYLTEKLELILSELESKKVIHKKIYITFLFKFYVHKLLKTIKNRGNK